MRQGCHGSKLRVVCLYEIHSPESDRSPTDSIAKNQKAMQPESPKNRVPIASNRRGDCRPIQLTVYCRLTFDLVKNAEMKNITRSKGTQQVQMVPKTCAKKPDFWTEGFGAVL